MNSTLMRHRPNCQNIEVELGFISILASIMVKQKPILSAWISLSYSLAYFTKKQEFLFVYAATFVYARCESSYKKVGSKVIILA